MQQALVNAHNRIANLPKSVRDKARVAVDNAAKEIGLSYEEVNKSLNDYYEDKKHWNATKAVRGTFDMGRVYVGAKGMKKGFQIYQDIDLERTLDRYEMRLKKDIDNYAVGAGKRVEAGLNKRFGAPLKERHKQRIKDFAATAEDIENILLYSKLGDVATRNWDIRANPYETLMGYHIRNISGK
jgi:hypothetical protein